MASSFAEATRLRMYEKHADPLFGFADRDYVNVRVTSVDVDHAMLVTNMQLWSMLCW